MHFALLVEFAIYEISQLLPAICALILKQTFVKTRPKPAYGRQGLDWDRWARIQFTIYVTNAGSQLTSMIKKRYVTNAGSQLTSMIKKRYVTNTGSQLTF